MHTISTKHLIGQRFLFDPYDNSLIDQHENNALTRLGSNESRALSLLIEEPGAIITRTRLHEYVWREQGFEVDDSSLTQAISTLRKALKDSTKAPGFIKTVPKRGYQMIAVVKECQDSPVTVPQDTLDEQPTATAQPVFSDTEQVQLQHDVNSATSTGGQKTSTSPVQTSTKMSKLTWLALAVAGLLPLLVNMGFPPKSTAFQPLYEVEGVRVLTPKYHPVLSDWQPIISSCVRTYLEYHQDKVRPVEVIVTGGQNNQLWLNYIHDTAVPDENVTLRLLTSQQDNSKICR
ncbi:winged helix-turn-helix domain-containing protein [Photobacterium lipolyticum]|uniref:Transcriptional regulator n=1 Tax=Photobacterium lipolyticum TaxID=266810 RepID=A0A2T3N4X0_9GAMM|nr:winged helix-turn-helix domain-containing protein [Photobacterium lipolyticum]PSW07502.1 transcriptional regulator [Photobacterium lipolyticum]